MASRTQPQIVNDMITALRRFQPEADTKTGTVVRDLMDAVSVPIRRIYDDLESTREIQTINRATGSALDRLAANFGVTRRPGAQANGFVLVNFSTLTSIISITDGTRISTNDNVEFQIIGNYSLIPAETTIYQAMAVQYKSILEQLGVSTTTYAFYPVVAEAVVSGSEGNAASGSIRNHSIVGIQNLVNIAPMSGGRPAATDEELRQDIKYAIVDGNVGTKEGLEAIAMQNPSLSAVKVIGPFDQGSTYETWVNLK